MRAHRRRTASLALGALACPPSDLARTPRVLAVFMAMQERYFGTLYQRVLDQPLDVRFHYGHPE